MPEEWTFGSSSSSSSSTLAAEAQVAEAVAETEAAVWNRLVHAIRHVPGGIVHDSLQLVSLASTTSNNKSNHKPQEEQNGYYRGVFHNKNKNKHNGMIRQGEILIQIPTPLALSGMELPSLYEVPLVLVPPLQQQLEEDKNNNTNHHVNETTTKTPTATQTTATQTTTTTTTPNHRRMASPWLRCLAAYWKAVHATQQQEQQHQQQKHQQQQQERLQEEDEMCHGDVDDDEDDDPLKQAAAAAATAAVRKAYLESLPTQYETVLQWSLPELQVYLGGTTTQSGHDWQGQQEPQSQQEQPQQQAQAQAQQQQQPKEGTETNSNGSMNTTQKELLRIRFETQVRPYLEFCKILSPATTVTTTTNNKNNDKEDYNCKDHQEHDDNKNNDNDELLLLFEMACQALSTRCFHLQQEQEQQQEEQATAAGEKEQKGILQVEDEQIKDPSPPFDKDNDDKQNYTGPFFIPVMDLLNHTNDPLKRCTTLRRTRVPLHDSAATTTRTTTRTVSCDVFQMVAERDIAVGEELLHSYGNTLTASQSLQTFGFIPEETSRQAASHYHLPCATAATATTSTRLWTQNLSRAILTKQCILEACWSVLQSNLPLALAKVMQERAMQDECWALDTSLEQKQQEHEKQRRLEICAYLPDNIVIGYNAAQEVVGSTTVTEDDDDDGGGGKEVFSLPDKLVTLAAIPFLPNEALQELFPSSTDSNNKNKNETQLVSSDCHCCPGTTTTTTITTTPTRPCLLGCEILEDYFLGKLVCASLFQAIHNKLLQYPPVHVIVAGEEYNGNGNGKPHAAVESSSTTTTTMTAAFATPIMMTTAAAAGLPPMLSASSPWFVDDATLLHGLLQKPVPSRSRTEQRCIYGLTVRLEEKTCLKSLWDKVTCIWRHLDDGNYNNDYDYDSQDDDDDDYNETLDRNILPDVATDDDDDKKPKDKHFTAGSSSSLSLSKRQRQS